MGYSSVAKTVHQPITVSVISHGQGELVAALLEDLASCTSVAEVILTQNIPEGEIACPESLRPRVRLIRNDQPLGFAANHNQAFRQCRTPLFAVLNPDIRLERDPFPPLTEALAANGVGLAAPAVRAPHGTLEDSARYFPTPFRLLAKLLKLGDGRRVVVGQGPVAVDWTAGMFMLFRADVFRDLGGFDEGFFLYYEDVDICVRLWRVGQRVMLHPGASVIHAAQRASRRRPRYMAWHLSSMARYFIKHLGRLPRTYT
jgi:N-acetylglucosaminyl-diphospho-decaprenol L-rhamnosyltransferase